MTKEIDIQKIFKGNRRSLAKAITLIESKLETDRQAAQQLLENILPHSGKSIRIGITGTPGVGKSTFIEAFGRYLIEQKKKVAVLAVDPSSPLNGGSLLGDKTRMPELIASEQAFIRPSPSAGALGGVAQKTRETMLICEAAGFDVILIETVGVGQSEVEVASMVDFFLVLMLPNAGDELQGIKKGILELADAIVINKADGDSEKMAEVTKAHYQNALHLLSASDDFWQTRTMTCSAQESKNIDRIWEMILEYQHCANDAIETKRRKQNKYWMNKLIHEMLDIKLKQNNIIQKKWKEFEQSVKEGKTTPYQAATKIISLLKWN